MPETTINTGSAVEVFVTNTLNQIKGGLKIAGCIADGSVEFDLQITEQKVQGASGNPAEINGVPVILTGEVSNQIVQRVRFSANLNDPTRK